eukprot:TRINITY_DN2668_c0_g1_i1.p1 TRINITY_DN2668_c0_g1~~TRINITY_DN2668_c0_g1_i1.p1  ORF type:complete len:595 (-),score=143.63 TRINITY_DN2668_c0_g1_i1:503-2146(-)
MIKLVEKEDVLYRIGATDRYIQVNDFVSKALPILTSESQDEEYGSDSESADDVDDVDNVITIFRLLDNDSTGRFYFDDALRVFKDVYGEDEIEALFNVLDADELGYVDFEMFAKGWIVLFGEDNADITPTDGEFIEELKPTSTDQYRYFDGTDSNSETSTTPRGYSRSFQFDYTFDSSGEYLRQSNGYEYKEQMRILKKKNEFLETKVSFLLQQLNEKQSNQDDLLMNLREYQENLLKYKQELSKAEQIKREKEILYDEMESLKSEISELSGVISYFKKREVELTKECKSLRDEINCKYTENYAEDDIDKLVLKEKENKKLKDHIQDLMNMNRELRKKEHEKASELSKANDIISSLMQKAKDSSPRASRGVTVLEGTETSLYSEIKPHLRPEVLDDEKEKLVSKIKYLEKSLNEMKSDGKMVIMPPTVDESVENYPQLKSPFKARSPRSPHDIIKDKQITISKTRKARKPKRSITEPKTRKMATDLFPEENKTVVPVESKQETIELEDDSNEVIILNTLKYPYMMDNDTEELMEKPKTILTISEEGF